MTRHIVPRSLLLFALALLGGAACGLPAQAQYQGDEYYNRGRKLVNAGQHREAIPLLTQAINMDGRNANAYSARGRAWAGLGDYDKALEDYDRALTVNPKDTLTYHSRSRLWELKGEYAKAIDDYHHILAIQPDNCVAWEQLAWLQATCPDANFRDGKKAFENATKAYQLSGGEGFSQIETVAVAYAECGDFEAAQQWQAKAIGLLEAEKDPPKQLLDQMRARLELFKQEKPYREEPKKKS